MSILLTQLRPAPAPSACVPSTSVGFPPCPFPSLRAPFSFSFSFFESPFRAGLRRISRGGDRRGYQPDAPGLRPARRPLRRHRGKPAQLPPSPSSEALKGWIPHARSETLALRTHEFIFFVPPFLSQFARSARGWVEATEISGNELEGIHIWDESDPVVVDCHVHSGLGGGILASAFGRGRIERNDVHGNAGPQIDVQEEADPLVLNNQLHASTRGGAGVLVTRGGFGRVEANTIFENEGPAIHINLGGDPVVTRNILWGNGRDGRKGTGIVLGADSRGERVAGDNVVKLDREPPR